MSFDNGAADEQSDPHSVALRGVERIEERAQTLRTQANSSVADRQSHSAGVVRLGLGEELTRSILHIDHRVGGIADQIQNDLLQLNPIAGDGREVVGELRMNYDAVSLKI